MKREITIIFATLAIILSITMSKAYGQTSMRYDSIGTARAVSSIDAVQAVYDEADTSLPWVEYTEFRCKPNAVINRNILNNAVTYNYFRLLIRISDDRKDTHVTVIRNDAVTTIMYPNGGFIEIYSDDALFLENTLKSLITGFYDSI